MLFEIVHCAYFKENRTLDLVVAKDLLFYKYFFLDIIRSLS